MEKLTFLAIFYAFVLAVFAVPVFAAELYVNTDGKVQISRGEVTYLNNNYITVTLWNTRWVLFVDTGDSYVKITNAAGEPITVWDLKKGHIIYVEGRMRDAGPGKIEINVGLLRDLSIAGSGSPAQIPAISQLVLEEVVSPASVSATSAVAPEPVVSHDVSLEGAAGAYLRRGMKGDEVARLQEALLSKKFIKDDEVTGYFGAATEAGVKRLQAEYKLEQVGFVGKQTKKIVDSLIKGQGTASALADSSSISAPERLTSNLKTGMRGSEVALLQEFLQKGGWGIPSDGPVTGYYGKVTVKAVANFQNANGLEPVGSVGPETRSLINSMLAGDVARPNPAPEPPSVAAGLQFASSKDKITKTLAPGMRGSEVVALQEFLQRNGWGIPDDGPVTGYYGSVTSRAVSRFQQANGLEAVGFVGPATRDLINKLLGSE